MTGLGLCVLALCLADISKKWLEFFENKDTLTKITEDE